MKTAWILATAFVLLLLAEPAFACAVCFDANDQTRSAFLGTTALLSLLPLGMMGGFGLWMYRRVRAMDSFEQDGQPSTP